MSTVTQTTIYIGLNDQHSKEQKYDTEKYLGILRNVCKNYGVAFSVFPINGGYFHDDGTYVEETTLQLVLLDVDQALIDEIAKDLCVFFNQESLLITTVPADMHIVKESL